jgi:hypothetical protein
MTARTPDEQRDVELVLGLCALDLRRIIIATKAGFETVLYGRGNTRDRFGFLCKCWYTLLDCRHGGIRFDVDENIKFVERYDKSHVGILIPRIRECPHSRVLARRGRKAS